MRRSAGREKASSRRAEGGMWARVSGRPGVRVRRRPGPNAPSHPGRKTSFRFFVRKEGGGSPRGSPRRSAGQSLVAQGGAERCNPPRPLGRREVPGRPGVARPARRPGRGGAGPLGRRCALKAPPTREMRLIAAAGGGGGCAVRRRCARASSASLAAREARVPASPPSPPRPRRLLPPAAPPGAAAAARGSVRCLSSPRPPLGGAPNLAWLCAASRWPPPAGNGADGGNGNGSASGAEAGRPVADSEFAPAAPGELDGAAPGGGRFDAVLVLAGGLTPDGGLPEYVRRRLQLARDVHMLQGRAPLIVCLGGGTPHKPPILGPSGHVLHESTACASYLVKLGVEPGAILKETSSYDTVGNAFFSLAIHAVPRGWRRLAAVTSDFHMPRSRALLADIYRLAGRSLLGDERSFTLTFLSSSDEGAFEPGVYAARVAKEAASLAQWRAVAPGLADLPSFHRWLFDDHLCYAVPRQHEFGRRTIEDQSLLDSY